MSGFSIWYTRQLLQQILIKPRLTKPRPAPVIPAWPNYTPGNPEMVYLSNISTVATVGSAPANTLDVVIGSPANSVDMPAFGTTIPSFGYSQASSSAGSLIPPTGNAMSFYQVRNSVEKSYHQGSSDLRKPPSTSSLNLRVSNGEIFQRSVSNTQSGGSNAQYMCSNTPAADPALSHGTPGSMATPASMASPVSKATPCLSALITDFADTPAATDGDSFLSSPSSTSTGRMTIRSFGTPRAIAAPKTGIPSPRGGTARSFTSRHGYTVTDVTTPIAERSASFGLGLGISVESTESPSFADEVDAEINSRHGPSLPPRKDSLPGVSNSPSTVDELNEMNEMDPAFTRAVQGLRMGSEDREVQDEQDDEAEEEEAEAGRSSKKDKKNKSKKKKKSRKHWF